jgi:hypothetical protein
MALPAGFADLEPFIGRWCLPDNQARMEAMAVTDMAGLRVFHDAMLPRLDAIIDHLNQFPLGDMPPGERVLLELVLTFAEVAHPVDLQWTTTEPGELFEVSRISMLGPSLAW